MKKIYLLAINIIAISTSMFSQNVNVSGALVGNGTYPDLGSAFTAINGGAQSGATILVNIAGNTTEPVSAVLNQSTGPWTSLTISPSGGASRTISGAIAGHMVDFNGADNVTIDGLNSGGNFLFIDNSNGGSSTSTIRFTNDASNNTIVRTNINGSAGNVLGTGFGVIYFGTGNTTGNDNNTINNCNISGSSGGTPLNAIYSFGSSTAIDNSNNTVTVCNISNFFSVGTASNGININSGSSGWTITNNSFYQTTAPRTATTGSTHAAINILTGNGYTVSNNIVGGGNPSGTGTAWTLSGTIASRFIGINISSSAGATSSVQNNTITNFALNTSSGATTGNGIWCGISINGAGTFNVGTTTGNTIGATSGTGSVVATSSTTGGLVVGINSTCTGTVTFQNNSIGALTCSGITAAVAGSITGINVSGTTANLTINNNTIGNATADNLRGGTSGLTTGSSLVSGINMPSSPTNLIISSNTIRNLASYGTGTTGFVRGIQTAVMPVVTTASFTNNTISNLTSNTANVSVANAQLAAQGIYVNLSITSATISGNTISNISLTNTGILATNATGISISNTGALSISKNRIYGITNASTATSTTAPGTATGIHIRGTSTNVTVSNNMISLGNSQTTNTAFIGIWYQGGGTLNPAFIYYNSVNIEGAVAAGAQPSFGFYRGNFSATAQTPTVDVRNNIFNNTRSGGTGPHIAIANNYGATASATGWASGAANNNVLNAAVAANVGWWTTAQTFANWKTTSSGDLLSVSGVSVPFAATSTADLHLSFGLTPTQIESGGVAIAGISDDYDNQVRPGPAGSVNGGALAPDMGADEFDGVPLDLFAPVINYTLLLNNNCTTTRTFTATMSDNSGVNGTVGTRPRVYFKKSTDANNYVGNTSVDNGWKYVEASNAASPFSFNIDYSIINGGSVVVGDVIQYFVVAQDLSPAVNVAINSGTFNATPTTVALTAAAFPIVGTINSYSIITGLATSLTVGVAGNYTSLTGSGGLFSAINANGLTGNTTVNILDASVTETGAFALNQIQPGDCSLTAYTLLIKPNTGVTSTLTGTLASSALIRILSNNVTIDGSNSGTTSRDLTITNLSATSPNVVLIGSTGTVPVNNVTLKNCIAINGINTSNAVVVSDGALIGTAGYFTNISIQNNNIQKANIGILNIAVVSPGNGSALSIKSNALNTSGVNAIKNIGVYVQGADGATISDNDIGNFETTTSEIDRGIWFATGTTNSVIERNNIHDLQYTGTSGYGTKGIVVSTGLAAANITIKNNMVSGMTGDADSYLSFGASYSPVGIYVFGTGQGGVNIYYNSINLYGATLNFAGDSYSIGIALDNNSSASIKNNIIRNTLGLSGATGYGAGGIAAFTSPAQFTALDYNDFYIAPASGFAAIGNIANSFYGGGLAGWQAAVGGGREANSLNIQPNFTSASDLHLVVSSNCRLDGYGTPIAGITTDYDVQTRDAGAPDMGADEFTTTPAPSTMTTASNCDTKNVSPLGTLYVDGACNLIAKVVPSGGSAVTGKIKTCTTLDGSQLYFNGQPYVQRHYDIEPSVNPSTSTATITLYFTDAEFALYNSNNPIWPPLPTNGVGNTPANRNNVKVTQFHGVGSTSPTKPGFYPGATELLIPGAANVIFNGTYWEVTIPVTSFSGFYVHTNNFNAPLPITVNYLTGRKQGSSHLLNWKVTCNSTPRATMTLERSADARIYTGINTITADAARCNSPFDYTDANPLVGMNYYRLKIVDADGKVTYSTTVALLNAVKGFDIISIAPNPVVNDNFKLNVASAVSGKMEVVIFDMQGRLVNRQSIKLIAGFNSPLVHVGNLASGTYTIRAGMTDEQSKIIRFVKQ